MAGPHAVLTPYNRRTFLKHACSAAAIFASARACAKHSALGEGRRKPNVVIILSDDVGYGDLTCYGGTHVHTPHLDGLAKSGLRFTNAHSDAATCTPSRYAMMTGDYAWRRNDVQILPGDAKSLIQPGQPTIASLFKSAGYATGLMGKWHLGLGDGHIDWNGSIKPGPAEVGFDEAFYFAATADRVPTVYLHDHNVVNLDPADPITVSYKEKAGTRATGREEFTRVCLMLSSDKWTCCAVLPPYSSSQFLRRGHGIARTCCLRCWVVCAKAANTWWKKVKCWRSGTCVGN